MYYMDYEVVDNNSINLLLVMGESIIDRVDNVKHDNIADARDFLCHKNGLVFIPSDNNELEEVE